MEEALIQYLLGLSPLTALTSTRIYWLRIPQGQSALPTVVLQAITSQRAVRNDGPDGLVSDVVQFAVYGASLSSALAVKRVLIEELEGLVVTTGGVHFQGLFVETDRQAISEPPVPPELPGYVVDMTVWHRPN